MPGVAAPPTPTVNTCPSTPIVNAAEAAPAETDDASAE